MPLATHCCRRDAAGNGLFHSLGEAAPLIFTAAAGGGGFGGVVADLSEQFAALAGLLVAVFPGAARSVMRWRSAAQSVGEAGSSTFM